MTGKKQAAAPKPATSKKKSGELDEKALDKVAGGIGGFHGGGPIGPGPGG